MICPLCGGDQYRDAEKMCFGHDWEKVYVEISNSLLESEQKAHQYREALMKIRQGIIDHATDTVWVSGCETVVDFIDSLLPQDPTNIQEAHNDHK